MLYKWRNQFYKSSSKSFQWMTFRFYPSWPGSNQNWMFQSRPVPCVLGYWHTSDTAIKTHAFPCILQRKLEENFRTQNMFLVIMGQFPTEVRIGSFHVVQLVLVYHYGGDTCWHVLYSLQTSQWKDKAHVFTIISLQVYSLLLSDNINGTL